METWEDRVIEGVARTVGARVIDPHDIPLLGPLAVEVGLFDGQGRTIVGNICSGSLPPDLETSCQRFSADTDRERIRTLISRLMHQGKSFVTRTRDGSVQWTIRNSFSGA